MRPRLVVERIVKGMVGQVGVAAAFDLRVLAWFGLGIGLRYKVRLVRRMTMSKRNRRVGPSALPGISGTILPFSDDSTQRRFRRSPGRGGPVERQPVRPRTRHRMRGRVRQGRERKVSSSRGARRRAAGRGRD